MFFLCFCLRVCLFPLHPPVTNVSPIRGMSYFILFLLRMWFHWDCSLTVPTVAPLLSAVWMRWVHSWVWTAILSTHILFFSPSSKPPCPLKDRELPDKKKKTKHEMQRGSTGEEEEEESFNQIREEGKQLVTPTHRKTLASTRRSSSPSTRKLMMLARRWITSDSTQSGSDKWAPASLTPASTRRKTNSHVSCYL